MCSRPSQNGQASSGVMVTDSSWKSERRLLRSVEMMTQRPVTGSFLSSDTGVLRSPECLSARVRLYASARRTCKVRLYDRGVEGVSIYLNARPAIVHVDGDHVEPARAVVQPVPGQIVYGHLREAALFPCRDRLGAAAELFADSGLDLHEHRRAGVAGDDVNFSKLRAVAAIKNCVPQPLELGAREIFPQFSEDLPGIVCHARL